MVFSIKPCDAIEDFRFFVKFSSGVSGEEITSLEHVLTRDQTRTAIESQLSVEFDTSSIRPGIYPIYIWLGDSNNGSICYDCIDNATKPLLITKDGSPGGNGVFELHQPTTPAT